MASDEDEHHGEDHAGDGQGLAVKDDAWPVQELDHMAAR
jgi:hypothetical protein